MKNIIVLLGIIVMIIAAEVTFGQGSEGVIQYEVKIDIHRMLPPERSEMKEVVPQFRAHRDQLLFNASESLYKTLEEEEEEPFESDRGGLVRMRVRRPTAEVYINQQDQKRITLQELMGKKYLIEDSLRIHPWKLGSETRTILDYPCRQASFYDEERKQHIVAWYTDKFRPFLGPESFNTLPGAVLAIEINGGERTVTATGIEFRGLKKNELKIPSGGTKSTPEEFRKITEEMRERMRSNGGGNWIIRN